MGDWHGAGQNGLGVESGGCASHRMRRDRGPPAINLAVCPLGHFGYIRIVTYCNTPARNRQYKVETAWWCSAPRTSSCSTVIDATWHLRRIRFRTSYRTRRVLLQPTSPIVQCPRASAYGRTQNTVSNRCVASTAYDSVNNRADYK